MMDKICATCKYWEEPVDLDRYDEIIFPYRVDGSYKSVQSEEEAAAMFGHRVRRCSSPKILFYQRPAIDGATVCDGSEFKAVLITGERFSCAGWTTIDETTIRR